MHLLVCPNLIRRCTCCQDQGRVAILRDPKFPCARKLMGNHSELDQEASYRAINELVTELEESISQA